MKISVIIPVYNAENFLKRCLESVLSQTLADIEILCIDDSSSDSSFKILEEYSKIDTRLKCYRNEKNIGQGLTRNKGIDLAQGEYIAFVDCDDWIEADMYEILYSKTNIKKYDVIYCNLAYDFSDGTSKNAKMPESKSITCSFLINEAISPSIKYFSPNSPCDKIFKRESIEKLKLRFESERVFLYEDKLFNLIFLASNPSFFFEPKVLYHYTIRYGSTMTSYKNNFVERYFLMDKNVKELLNKNELFSDESAKRLRGSLFEMTFVFCLNSLVYNKSLKGKISNFWSLINDKRISSNAKYFKISDIPESSSKINGLVKCACFLILKYLR